MLPAVLIAILLGLQGVYLHANAHRWRQGPAANIARSPTLESAQRFFYNGQYDAAAAATLALCAARPDDLAACELRTSTLLFQIKRALGDRRSDVRALGYAGALQLLIRFACTASS